MCKEADEERRPFIAHRDHGLHGGLHGLGQHLQAKPSERSRRLPSTRVCPPAGTHARLSSHLLMSRGRVRTWFFTHVADLCRKPPSLTWWSACRTTDWTPATHTLLSLASSESVKVMDVSRGLVTALAICPSGHSRYCSGFMLSDSIEMNGSHLAV